METNGRDRRRLRNMLVQPRKQLRYAMHFFVFAAMFGLFAQWMTYRAVQTVIDHILAQAGQAGTLGPVIDDAIAVAVLQSAWLLPFAGFAALVYSAVLLHRFVGPLVPIRRHLKRLESGDYSADCSIRAHDEMHELVDDVSRLTDALRQQDRAGRVPPIRRIGQSGFSIIELLAVLTVISVLAMIGVSQFIAAYDRARQRSTLADMRSVAVAASAFHVDKGDYPTSFDDLEPYYIQAVATVDRWGNAWVFESDDAGYQLSSLGKDADAGPTPPDAWIDEPFECDLVLRNGAFVQAPVNPGA